MSKLKLKIEDLAATSAEVSASDLTEHIEVQVVLQVSVNGHVKQENITVIRRTDGFWVVREASGVLKCFTDDKGYFQDEFENFAFGAALEAIDRVELKVHVNLD